MRIAVIGCGEMGKKHARKLSGMKDIDLIGVCDPDDIRADTLAEELGCDSYHDHWEFLGEVDAAVVATNPNAHGEVACDLLNNGVHVLVEKPIAMSDREARTLMRTAGTIGVVLQVGHIERFNPVFRRISSAINCPFTIEAHRHAEVDTRIHEVGVVLDLMIHDIDLVLSIAKSELSKVSASGTSDYALAELRFEDGSVAVLHANRKAWEKYRMWVVNDDKHYLITDHDYLTEELRHFIDCIRGGDKPLVGGEEGRAALKVALEVTRMVKA